MPGADLVRGDRTVSFVHELQAGGLSVARVPRYGDLPRRLCRALVATPMESRSANADRLGILRLRFGLRALLQIRMGKLRRDLVRLRPRLARLQYLVYSRRGKSLALSLDGSGNSPAHARPGHLLPRGIASLDVSRGPTGRYHPGMGKPQMVGEPAVARVHRDARRFRSRM